MYANELIALTYDREFNFFVYISLRFGNLVTSSDLILIKLLNSQKYTNYDTNRNSCWSQHRGFQH